MKSEALSQGRMPYTLCHTLFYFTLFYFTLLQFSLVQFFGILFLTSFRLFFLLFSGRCRAFTFTFTLLYSTTFLVILVYCIAKNYLLLLFHCFFFHFSMSLFVFGCFSVSKKMSFQTKITLNFGVLQPLLELANYPFTLLFYTLFFK